MHDRAAQDEEGGVSYKLKFAELDILRNDIRKTGRQTQPYAAENYMQDRPPI